MTLAYGTAAKFLTSASSGQYSHAKLSGEKTIVAFSDFGNLTFSATVINGGSDPPTFGTQSDIVASSGGYGDIAALGTDKAVVAYSDTDDSNKGKVRVLTVSGTTITQQTATTFESGSTEVAYTRCTLNSNGDKGCIAYRVSGNCKLCRFTVSGNTITADSPVNLNSLPSTAYPIAMSYFDTGAIIFWYRRALTEYRAIVVDISGTISQATHLAVTYTPDTIPNVAAHNCIIALNDIKAIVNVLDDAGSDPFYLLTLTRSLADGSLSIGTPYQVDTNAGNPNLDKISSSRVFLAWEGDGTPTVETFNVTGGVVTPNGDGVAGATGVPIPIVTATTNNQALVVYESSEDGYAIPVSNLPAVSGFALTHSAGGVPGSILV